MLKLIASDMDGTMLDANECVPDGTYELILRLREEGVRFAATSGRRFDTLCELFEPIVDCMDFVASNGAQVIVEGELVDLEVFSHAAVRTAGARGGPLRHHAPGAVRRDAQLPLG